MVKRKGKMNLIRFEPSTGESRSHDLWVSSIDMSPTYFLCTTVLWLMRIGVSKTILYPYSVFLQLVATA